MRYLGGTIALASMLMGGCNGFGKLPWPPLITTIIPGNASAVIGFTAPIYEGLTAISAYDVSCVATDEILHARGTTSPITVFGMRNGYRYACTVRASNSTGTGDRSDAVSVTPQPDPALSLASGYRQAAWASGLSVTFPNACTMTVWPSERPSHTVDEYYLTPALTNLESVSGAINIQTKVSGMSLEVTTFQGASARSPMQFNICPNKAQVPITVNAGGIGVLISGSVLFAAAEISGHRATSIKDNVIHSFKSRNGTTMTASYVDRCNGHPTPVYAGNIYHYHGFSECVTSLVDRVGGPSHLIGIALDGYPIYGDRDINGKLIPPQALDACNGIFAPTPEFPQGVYHYVLPSGVEEHNASMRCYWGNIALKDLAIADTNGFCYSSQTKESIGSTGRMMMGEPSQ